MSFRKLKALPTASLDESILKPIPYYESDLKVTSEHIDMLGHVNNVAYLEWMQEAAIRHSDSNGWSWERYHSLGCGWVAKEHFIEYLLPVFLNEPLKVKTWVAGMKRVSSRREYLFFRGENDVVAKAYTNWAFVELETMSLKRIPDEVKSCFVIPPSE